MNLHIFEVLRLDRLETIWLEEKRAGEILDASYVVANTTAVGVLQPVKFGCCCSSMIHLLLLDSHALTNGKCSFLSVCSRKCLKVEF